MMKKGINIIANDSKRSEDSSDTRKKNKIDFKEKKENTLNSLFEVEHFLEDFKHFSKYAKLYFLLK